MNWQRQDNVEKVADRIYLGSYLWKDLTWKSKSCMSPGRLPGPAVQRGVRPPHLPHHSGPSPRPSASPSAGPASATPRRTWPVSARVGWGWPWLGHPSSREYPPERNLSTTPLGNTDLSAVTSSSSAELGENINKSVHILLGKSLEKKHLFSQKDLI